MTDRKHVTRMMLFANGSIAAFDAQAQQIPELQMRSAIELWAEYAVAAGWDVDGCECRTQQPGGVGPACTIDGSMGEIYESWQ